MKSKLFLTVLCLVSTASALRAQETLTEAVTDWEREKTYTIEYLDAMPEASYGFKPTPEMRSFADQMLHLADANYGLTSAATGDKSPVTFGDIEKTADKSKANVKKLVIASYDYAIASVKKMTPAKLTEHIKMFEKFDCSRAQMLAKAYEHQAHHRGQTTVYIRLAGAKPPQEKLF